MALPVGPQHVKLNDEVAYFIPGEYGATIEWTVTGGEIISGQGTYHITVLWTTEGEGRVEVSVTNEGRETEVNGITVIIDPDLA
jgi:hypothetical protein